MVITHVNSTMCIGQGKYLSTYIYDDSKLPMIMEKVFLFTEDLFGGHVKISVQAMQASQNWHSLHILKIATHLEVGRLGS